MNKMTGSVFTILLALILIGLSWNAPSRLSETTFSDFIATLDTPLEAVVKIGVMIFVIALSIGFKNHKG